MSTSPRHIALGKRIDELKSSLLPSLSATGSYTPQEYDRTRAFVVLSHAELEQYLEDRIEEELNLRLAAWNKSREPSQLLMGVLAYHEGAWPGPVPSVAKSKGNESSLWDVKDTNARVQKATKVFNALLSEFNHGISEKHILRMLLPLGIDLDGIDPAFLIACSTFSALRGRIAHRAAFTAKTPPDPKDVVKQVDDLLVHMGNVDTLLSALK